MSELAVELRNRPGVYTRTTGNITQLFFQKEEDDGIPRGSIRQFGAPEGAPGFPLYREAADAADQLEPAATHRPTARDLELAKPDTVDMAVMPLESYDQVHGMISYFETRKNLRRA